MTPAAEKRARAALASLRRAEEHLSLAAQALAELVGAASDHTRLVRLLERANAERHHLASRIEDDEPWHVSGERAP